MTVEEKIQALDRVSIELEAVLKGEPGTTSGGKLLGLMDSIHHHNPWFTKEMLVHRVQNISGCLRADVTRKWLNAYELKEHPPKEILVILAGNIPLAGFDDLLAVLANDDIFRGKLASDDKILFPAFCDVIMEMVPEYRSRIVFTEGKQEKMDAVIATGSNNSGRYFEHYFSKYPHIIRKNRNAVAVLSGKETPDELKRLADDIFLYFGAGCRSVSKLFVPAGYDFHPFFEGIFHWGERMMHNSRYMNNYEYNKTVYLLNNEKLLDNNFLVLKEHIGIASPPGVVYFEYYTDAKEVDKKIRGDWELIQCIVSSNGNVSGSIPFGTTQLTRPWDHADGIDVLTFLSELS